MCRPPHHHSEHDVVLLLDGQAGFAQFVRQGVFIDFFKKANTECIRNDECTSDNFLRNEILECTDGVQSKSRRTSLPLSPLITVHWRVSAVTVGLSNA